MDIEAAPTSTFTCSSQSSWEEDTDTNNRRLDRHRQHTLPLSSLQRVNSVLARNKKSIQVENEVTNALANRAFHLPGYSYCADWCQYMVNNHLLFGMCSCCRHSKHPIGTKMRAINLLGSAFFGLAITNCIWLAYIYYDQDPDSVLFQISFQNNYYDNKSSNSNTTAEYLFSNATNTSDPIFEIVLPGTSLNEEEALVFQITKGMMLLWTLGGSLHAIYDGTVWYASACICCIAGNRCESWGSLRRFGSYGIAFLVVLIVALASFAVVVRATLLSHQDDTAMDMNEITVNGLVQEFHYDLGIYEFVLSYFVEFTLALFVYYPLFGTILFTGALNWVGCGKVRWLGGRPYEYEMEQQQRQQQLLERRQRQAPDKNGSCRRL